MTSLRAAALIALLASSCPALAQDGGASAVALLTRPGVEIAVGQEDGQDAAVELRLTSGRLGLQLKSVLREPRAGFLAAGRTGAGEVAFPDLDDPTSGRIRFSAMTTDDLRLVPVFLSGAQCPADVAGPLVPAKFSLRDVSLRATRRMLPKGENPERIDIAELDLVLRTDPAATCFILEEVAVRSATGHAIDGATFFFAELRGLLRQGSFGLIAEVDLRGLAALDAGRNEVMSLGLVRLRAKSDKTLSEIESGLGALQGIAAQAVRVAELADPELDIALRGLHFPLGRLLPEADRAKLGLDKGALVQGDARLELSAPGRKIEIAAEANLPGLLQMRSALTFGAPPQAADHAAPALPGLEAFSALVPILGLDLHSVHLSFQDKGARPLIEAVTGRALEDDIANSLTSLGPISAQMDAPLRAWLREAFFLGASLDLAPAEPVGLLRVVVQAMMDPEALPVLLGLTTSPSSF